MTTAAHLLMGGHPLLCQEGIGNYLVAFRIKI
jgi:hypothetical protein